MQLNWNTGGWFGSQLGGTVWILVAVSIALGHSAGVGLTLLAIFLVPNMVGYLLWHRRLLSCLASFQVLFTLVGMAGLLAIFVLDRNDLWLEIQKGGYISAGFAYTMLILMVMVLMMAFYLRFGRKYAE